MDYTKIPRALIYKERTNLNDFGIKTPGTLNNYLFTQMRRMTLLRCGDAKEIALRCFNNAYYICTLTQLDEFPDLSVDKYESLLLPDMIPFPEDVYQASMALVCVLLAAYDDKYKQKDEPLIESIHHWTSHNKWMNSNAHKSFEDIIEKCSPDGFSLAPDTFAPRDIVEVIENANVNNLIFFPEYISERLVQLKKPCQHMYGTDTAIARIKDEQRELCEDSEYNPKKDCFEYAYDYTPSLEDFTVEDNTRERYQQCQNAIEYYTKHYPTKEENNFKEEIVESAQTQETEALQVTIRDLQSKLSQQESKLIEVSNINNQYANRIKELEEEKVSLQGQLKEAHTIPDTVIAQQRVRMELARKLMDAAGINEDVLAKWGNKDKAGTIMGTMLDIRPSTCKTYLSDPMINYEYHKNTVDIINSLLEALGLKFKL